MFFFFSKILSFLFSPLSWILALLLFALFKKKAKTKRKFLLTAIIVFLFFSNQFIAAEFMRMWEPAHIEASALNTQYDVAIVVGGGMVTYDAMHKDITFRNNTDRIMKTIHLYNQGKVDKILISGGSGSLNYRNMLEAPLLKSYFIENGIPSQDIWVDSVSYNTHENAVQCAKILNDSLPGGDYLLITSASHMRRTSACFREEGIVCDYYPVDFNTGKRNWFIINLLIPNLEALKMWKELIHEVSGYIVYAIAGYL